MTVLWVTALVVVHFGLHVGLGIGAAAPDLLSVALLIIAREVRIGSAAGTGLLFGLLEDAVSVLSFGAHSLALTLVGAFGAVTREFFVGDSRWFAVSYLFVGKWLRDLLHWVLVGEDLRRSFTEAVLVQGTLGAVYVAATGLVVLGFIGAAGES